MRVHQTICLVLLCLAVHPVNAEPTSGRLSGPPAPPNIVQNRGTRAIGNSKAETAKSKEPSAGKPVDPAFMKTLNEVLMKFLRDVATVVKESPVDAEKIQEADVSRILANSLAASIPNGSRYRIPPQRRLPPKVPANHIVPLETASSLGGGVHRGVEQSLSYWNNGTKNIGESSDSKATTTLTSEGTSKSSSDESLPKSLKRLPIQKMTKYGLDKLKRHRVPFKSIQKIELEPARSPPSKLRHSVQKLNRGITRIFRERSRLHSIAWRHRANATDSSDNSRKIPENGFSRKEKAQQNLSTQEQKTSKSLSGRADVIVRKHTAADLTETISRPATSEKKTLPIEKLSAPAGIAPTQKNPTAPQDVSPKSKVKPKQEPRTDSLRTKQRLPTGTGSKASQRHSGLKYRAAARPTHSISKWHPAHNGPQAHPAQQRHSSLHYSNTVQSRPSPSDWRHRSTQNRFPSPPAQPTSHKKELGPSPQLQLRFANESLQSRSGREEVLNDMVFDLFTKLGVQSFAMKTIEGTLRGVADPKQTHFIPLQFVQPSSQRQSNPYAVNLRAPYNSSPQSEHNDVRVAARGALQSAATVNRTTMNRTTVRDRSGSPSPIFFRNNAGKAIPWKRTAGVTRKELRRSRMKTHRR